MAVYLQYILRHTESLLHFGLGCAYFWTAITHTPYHDLQHTGPKCTYFWWAPISGYELIFQEIQYIARVHCPLVSIRLIRTVTVVSISSMYINKQCDQKLTCPIILKSGLPSRSPGDLNAHFHTSRPSCPPLVAITILDLVHFSTNPLQHDQDSHKQSNMKMPESWTRVRKVCPTRRTCPAKVSNVRWRGKTSRDILFFFAGLLMSGESPKYPARDPWFAGSKTFCVLWRWRPSCVVASLWTHTRNHPYESVK